ncbi:Lon protease family protein [Ostreibacterium oceani]|uniref:endopeptidase La n=1 Tax=Ostreibacterium oceani TaxID=2654998 RepID=A0A6N7ERH6_9GAMM|nr:ATP-binding protein [Ostreibacterium oceani]MPV85474.1 AAA family ATPase [Ostreibacterium oceani]
MKHETFRVSDDALYWQVNPEDFPFNTTKDIKPTLQVYGHDTAKSALAFAIECEAPGFNAYVRGLSGAGRKTLVKKVLSEIKPRKRRYKDYCYVHNFQHPNAPRLITLEGGYGKLFKQMMCAFADYVVNDLPKTFNGDAIRQQRKAVEEKTNQRVAEIYRPLEEKLAAVDLALANVKQNGQMRMVIAPTYEGQIVSNEEVIQLLQQKKISQSDVDSFNENIDRYQEMLMQAAEAANEEIEASFADIRQIDTTFAREQLSGYLDAISKKFTHADVDAYVDEIVDDFVQNILHSNNKSLDVANLYGVNILSSHESNQVAPVIFESSPTLTNLLGSVESEGKLPPYASISAGSLLKADGGFLIIEVDEALAESGTWATIMRTIHSGKLSIAFEDQLNGRPAVIRPDPIPLDVKVILIGSHERFYQLKAYEATFSDNFKVLVDLDTALTRQADSFLQYAQVVRKVVDQEGLLHFDKTAIAQLVEHGARLSQSKDKISARFGRVMDTAREASYLAQKADADMVTKQHIVAAIRAKKHREYAPAKRFYDYLSSGTIIIETAGERVGQINGLAVAKGGGISYGFPARITTTIAPGKAGIINIEEKADLSGQIHTKGVQILGGLLRYLLKPDHAIAFSASIAFEQSYGGIDGDSASGAEACCLLSALTDMPIKQSLSITGAIDQFGNLQAIGGVNEKIEGFYDCCQFDELTGNQGVIIPATNVGELMLRDDVVRACREGRFHIYAVDHILDAFAILTDSLSCKAQFLHQTTHDTDTVLVKASDRLKALCQQSTNG